MQRTLIVLLIFAVLVAFFALQNSAHVEVKLWFWSVDTSLALVVILTFSIGALVGILFSFSGKSKKEKPTTGQSPDEVPLHVTPDPSQQEGGDPEFEDVI